MSQCYKCQREIPDGQIECEPFCMRSQFSDEDCEAAEREYLESTVPIDWDKVQTVEDIKLIMRHAAMYEDRVPRSSPAFEELKRFLKL